MCYPLGVLTTFHFRLYPKRSQIRALEHLLDLHRELYNAALEERREAWKRLHISVRYLDQAQQLKEIRTLRPDLAELNYSSCQQTLRRLDKSFQSFFRRVQAGETAGYPRASSPKTVSTP